MRGDENVVWIGDFKTWGRRWGGVESGRNREGERVEDWLNEW